METKHTPGPWHLSDHYSDALTVLDAGGFEVVTAKGIAILQGYGEKLGIDHWADSPDASRDISEEEQAANARLIAAAPELLEALESLEREGWFRYIVNAVKKETDRTDLYDAVTQARAAIAKATGA